MINQNDHFMPKAKILLIDDQENQLLAIKKMLEELNVDIYMANSSYESLKLVKEHQFAVVILDLNMTKINVIEIAEFIRNNQDIQNTSMIFITSYNKDKIKVLEGYQAGAVDYIYKPIDSHILKLKVQIFINLYNYKTYNYEKVLQELRDVKLSLKNKNQQLQDISLMDPLTELPNRKQFEVQIDHAMNYANLHKTIFAVLFLNIDNFKRINDRYGFSLGSKILKIIAKKLHSYIENKGFLGHLGGDEFVILLNKINHPNDAGKIADELSSLTFNELNELGENDIKITFTIGISCYPFIDKTTFNLIKCAELAMYRAKSIGKSNWCFFDQDLNNKYRNRLVIEKSLRQALEKQEFYLVYQMIYYLKSKKPSGIEALLRWKHPILGHVLPNEFISIAEDIGLFQQISKWVIDKACTQFAEWSLAGIRNLAFSINLSHEQLQKGDLVTVAKEALTHVNLAANTLELELSESVIMSRGEGVHSLIKELHDMGFKITIDNFGTSYSSLAILKELAVNTLKIDHSFVKEVVNNHETAVIVKAILTLAKELGLRVIAEGIETKEQLEFFIQEGCEEGQGFLLSKPQTADDLAKFLVREFSV